MNFIFSKLPLDIIKYEILPFDKHFVIRKGKLVTIKSINKNDRRYQILKNITIEKHYYYIIGNHHKRQEYKFTNNLHNPIERSQRKIDNDILEVTICYRANGSIEYNISIWRLRKKSELTFTDNVLYIPYIDSFCWFYKHIHYIRS